MSNMNSVWRSTLWFAIPLYLISNIYLIYLGEISGVMLLFAYTVYTGLLGWLTMRVTTPQPVEETQPQQSKRMLWIQIGILLIVIIFTGIGSNIPLWSNIVNWFYQLGEATLPAEWFGGPGNSIANPMQYFVIPFIILLLMGVKPAELGLGKGHKVWQASLIWLALPVVIWVVLLVMGLLPVQTLARRIIGNFFQNGFFEEFLMRGALQTRLKNIISTPWALTIQAIVFGLWHLRANTASMDGNLLAGIAICIASQAVGGFVYGYVFERTRNLVVPTIAHVAMNALSQSFGSL